FTAVLAVPLTRAVNCNCANDATVALSGVSERLAEELDGAATLFDDVVLHETASTVTLKIKTSERKSRLNFRPCWRHAFGSKCRTLHIQGNLETELGGPSSESLSRL
ncbi:MAG: hypothetical protein WAK22_14575, partial [Candidatus Sulfotelmatobacter sp.]